MGTDKRWLYRAVAVDDDSAEPEPLLPHAKRTSPSTVYASIDCSSDAEDEMGDGAAPAPTVRWCQGVLRLAVVLLLGCSLLALLAWLTVSHPPQQVAHFLSPLIGFSSGNHQPRAQQQQQQHHAIAMEAFGATLAAAGDVSHYPLNAYRLSRLFDRLQRGEAVAVGVVGGSNSAGHKLADPHRNMYNGLLDWLTLRFPTAQPGPRHTLRNHARPATTSAFASWCLDDLIPGLNGSVHSNASLSLPPIDLFFVEYAANDMLSSEAAMVGSGADTTVVANMERLVRRTLLHTAATAVMYVYSSRQNYQTYDNAEAEHEQVARRYGVPSVSFRRTQEHLRRTPAWYHMLADFLKNQDAGGPSTNRTLMVDPAHASDLGHQLLADLITTKLGALYDDYVGSSKRSFLPAWLWPQPAATGDQPGEARNDSRIVPLPLPPPSLSGLDTAMRCQFTQPYRDENTTFAQLAVQQSQGWKYATRTHTLSTSSLAMPLTRCGVVFCFLACDCWLGRLKQLPDDKAAVIPSDGCNATAGTAAGCWISFRLPSAISNSTQLQRPPSAVVALFVRSWQATLGEAWAWLSCSAAPRFHSVPVQLASLWEQKNTQTGMADVYRTGVHGVWEDTQLVAAAGVGQATTSTLTSAQGQGQREVEGKPPCRLDTLVVWHKAAGEFRLIGYMWDDQQQQTKAVS